MTRRGRARRRTSASPTSWGDVVEYTFTIESTGGSALVVPGYGFLLNNELTDFNYDSRRKPNRVQGGKRPRSSISPTIVLRGGSRGWCRLARRLDDHHDGARAARRADRSRDLAAARDRGAAREPAQHAATDAEPAFLESPEAAALSARGHVVHAEPPRSARRPASSASAGAACSPRPSRCGAAAAARSVATRRR